MRVALVNTNRIRPPIAPIGLEYVAEALSTSGHEVEILDLCWEEGWERAVASFFSRREYRLVGISIRNTDDCSLSSRESFLPEHASISRTVREHTGALIVLGGVGFSIMPEEVLEQCGADAGVRGDGEFALPELTARLERNEDWGDISSLIFRRNGRWRRNAVSTPPLADLPPMSRGFLDNLRYFREGGQAGFETKRGCPCGCVYCADPLAKGKISRLRPAAAVVDEIARLLAQGIDHFHTCDSEFNVPEDHARKICEEILERGLGGKLRWYAYCAPAPFSPDLANLMRRAGCIGINFGVDSGDDGILQRLGRSFGTEDIFLAARSCREAGITVMFDLLIGSPGETRESILRTIDMVKRAAPDRAGVAAGVRVYPGTKLAGWVLQGERKKGLIGGEDLSRPVFYIDPEVAPILFDLLDELTRDDPRFLFFDPSRPASNYNYNANQLLVDAIREGYRGAYWDVLCRYGTR